MFRTCLYLSAILMAGSVAGMCLVQLNKPGNADWLWRDGRSRTAWLEQLQSTEETERLEAAAAIGKMGPKVIPDVLEILRENHSQSVQQAAINTLAQMGEPAIPALTEECLRQGKFSVGRQALVALVKIGRPGVPHWIEMLNHNDANRQQLALSIIRSIGPDAEDAVPAMSALLRPDSPYSLADVITTLAAIGPAAKPCLPALIDLAECGDDNLASLAEIAISAIRH